MQEILKNLLENTTGLWIAFCGFMGAEATAIITLVINVIKLRANKEYTKNRLEEFLASQDIQLNESIESKLDAKLEKMQNNVNAMVGSVMKKLKIDSEEKEQAAAQNSLKLEELIQSTVDSLK